MDGKGAEATAREETCAPIDEGAECACGNVPDGWMDIVDAIACASWLRSKVASHRLGELATSLSPYDVENVQGLATRLLLECLRA